MASAVLNVVEQRCALGIMMLNVESAERPLQDDARE
jgi:hypothetical protein